MPLRRQVLLFLGFVFSVTLIILAAGVSQFVRVTEADAWHDRQLESVEQVALTTATLLDHVKETLVAAGQIDPDQLQAGSPLGPGALAQLLARTPSLLEIVVVGPDGEVIAEAHSDKSLLARPNHIAQAAWFQQAGPKGRPATSYLATLLALPVTGDRIASTAVASSATRPTP